MKQIPASYFDGKTSRVHRVMLSVDAGMATITGEAERTAPITELRVDGGAVANDLLVQFQSDILGVDVVRPQITETTALGAAYLAGLAVGYWQDVGDIQDQWKLERRFTPTLDAGVVTARTQGWQRAINASKAWADAVESNGAVT